MIICAGDNINPNIKADECVTKADYIVRGTLLDEAVDKAEEKGLKDSEIKRMRIEPNVYVFEDCWLGIEAVRLYQGLVVPKSIVSALNLRPIKEKVTTRKEIMKYL